MLKGKTGTKNLVWRIHSWAGLYAGVIIAFLSITGAAALFRFEFDQTLNSGLRKTEEVGNWAVMDYVIHPIIKAHPDKQLFEIELPKQKKGTWNIRLTPKEKSKLYPVIWEVFVDPYSGKVLGERN
ncbi:MAG: PepSY-associated TM helix domain-containing protein, partial [Bacteroidota bacterium]